MSHIQIQTLLKVDKEIVKKNNLHIDCISKMTTIAPFPLDSTRIDLLGWGSEANQVGTEI